MSGYVEGYTYKSIDIEHSVLKQADFKPCFQIRSQSVTAI